MSAEVDDCSSLRPLFLVFKNDNKPVKSMVGLFCSARNLYIGGNSRCSGGIWFSIRIPLTMVGSCGDNVLRHNHVS